MSVCTVEEAKVQEDGNIAFAMSNVRVKEDHSVANVPGTCEYEMSFAEYLVLEAWMHGCDFEKEADGLGAGEGTWGDENAISSSSPEAMAVMLLKALNFIKDQLEFAQETKGLDNNSNKPLKPGEVHPDDR